MANVDKWLADAAKTTKDGGHPFDSDRVMKRLPQRRSPVLALITPDLSVDLALMGDRLDGFESKSDFDTCKRLPSQVKAFSSVFDTMTIISKNADIPELVKLTSKELDIPDQAKAADTIKRLLSNLATITQGVAELRNHYGTGHGKVAGAKGLQPRHAKLAVSAASTLAVFLAETHNDRSE